MSPTLQPLSWIDTRPLFRPLHEALIHQLEALNADDWETPTVAGVWRVRDVAAHLLDGDLRVLSALRDGHNAPPSEPLDTYDALVGFLDRLNAEWVTVAQRLSPRVLVDLLRVTGPEVARTFASLPPHAPAPFPVAWAGENTSETWMHVGREYTERWHHQMQIRYAVGAPGLLEPAWFVPLLDLSVRALPHAYRTVEAQPGTHIALEVTGPSGGTWSLICETSRWRIFQGHTATPNASIQLDPETAWRSLYHALPPEEAQARAHIEGPIELASPFFAARSVMV